MAGFCELAVGLWTPNLAASGAKSPIVSGGYLKYSRFSETTTGDRVRSPLRGGGASVKQSETDHFTKTRRLTGICLNSDDHKAPMDEIARCLESDTRRRVPARSPNFMAGDAE
jgi:hypothetical protein